MTHLYTVTQSSYIDGRLDDILPFVRVFPTLEQAQEAVREAAREDHLALAAVVVEVPEMEGPYFDESGLEASDIDRFHGDFASDWTDWQITKAILED
jgi:hypothetical protein